MIYILLRRICSFLFIGMEFRVFIAEALDERQNESDTCFN